MIAVHRFRIWCGFALIGLVLPFAAFAQSATGVGFAPITIHDPVNDGTMPGYVFYPSTAATGVTRVGSYELHATRGAVALPGAKPLVVISHGHGGSDLGHHDVLDGRPIQVRALIGYLLNDPHWKTLVDPDRIGVTGFSAGGYTALMVVGAVPHFELFVAYCKRHPDDAEDCAMLQKWQSEGPAGAAKLQAALTGLRDGLHRWGNPDDSRVKAAFVMAPLSLVFDAAGLASINRPVFLYYGQNDPVLLPNENVLHIAPLIKTLIGIKMIPKAGHYVFLSPCSPQLAREVPNVCKDPPGVNRALVHRQINAAALAFFRKTLIATSH